MSSADLIKVAITEIHSGRRLDTYSVRKIVDLLETRPFIYPTETLLNVQGLGVRVTRERRLTILKKMGLLVNPQRGYWALSPKAFSLMGYPEPPINFAPSAETSSDSPLDRRWIPAILKATDNGIDLKSFMTHLHEILLEDGETLRKSILKIMNSPADPDRRAMILCMGLLMVGLNDEVRSILEGWEEIHPFDPSSLNEEKFYDAIRHMFGVL